MAYGLEIINSNGKVFATPDTPFFHMTSRQNVNIGGGSIGNTAINYNTSISSNLRMVCYVRCSTQTFVTVSQYQSNGSWWLKIESSVACTMTLYLFTNDIPASSSGWGLDFFDSAGRRIFSTSTKPLQNMQTSLVHTGTTTIDVGYPTAAIASICDAFVKTIPQGRVQMMTGSPCAYGNRVDLVTEGRGIMDASQGFSFSVFGGLVNYINSSLYD